MAKRPLKRATELSQEFKQDADYAALYREVANEEIGAALRLAREARGLSQREVAKHMGVTRARISQIESVAGTSLALEVLSRYAQAVGCQLDIALRDKEHKHKTTIFVPEIARASSSHIPPVDYKDENEDIAFFDKIIPYNHWAQAA